VPFVDRDPPPGVQRGIRDGLLPGEPQPDDDPLRVLRARIVEAPKSVRFGQRFSYVVELTNPTSRGLRLDPCPYFFSSFGESAIVSFVESYLNCAAKPAIGPGETARFAMVMTTPKEPFAGEGGLPPSLHWRLRGTSRVGTAVPVRVPKVDGG
jgi:hypothetical protein